MAAGYQPIKDNGIIVGDLHTVALVGLDGSIDFLCLPHFDAPTVFAALLDKDKEGNFAIHPVEPDVKPKQLYLPHWQLNLNHQLDNARNTRAKCRCHQAGFIRKLVAR